MSTASLLVLCIQAFLVQNTLSTLIGPAVYGNGFGLGNCAGAGLTAAAAEMAGWYGYSSPAQYGLPLEREIVAEYAYPPFSPWAREIVSPYPGPIIEAPLAGPFAAPYAYGPYEAFGAYGGEGIGEVTVLGEMPVAGTTLVNGQVPILGAVRFAGDLPAGGVVTIAGSCGCGCAY
ncbi:chorion class A protein Ld12-like [Zerene cesonia]|uniref:chorion class A protein Ld12-like n=1 Tax=Zerene cesonia TaxID=33412 RepID=UPI0018E53BF8|nr:chorion class A protein Ld12-like [Zerene cesonia]